MFHRFAIIIGVCIFAGGCMESVFVSIPDCPLPPRWANDSRTAGWRSVYLAYELYSDGTVVARVNEGGPLDHGFSARGTYYFEHPAGNAKSLAGQAGTFVTNFNGVRERCRVWDMYPVFRYLGPADSSIDAASASCCADKLTTTPAASSATAGNASKSSLSAMVGKVVHLQGRYMGPGKEADYIVVQGEEVYLKTGTTQSTTMPATYGQWVRVEGVLEHYTQPSTPQPDNRQAALSHYFIRNPRVTIVTTDAP